MITDLKLKVKNIIIVKDKMTTAVNDVYSLVVMGRSLEYRSRNINVWSFDASVLV